MRDQEDAIPLSLNAKIELVEQVKNYWWGISASFIICGLSALVTCGVLEDHNTMTWQQFHQVALYSVYLPFVIFISSMLFTFLKYGYRYRSNLYTENALDYDRSLRLHQVLNEFTQVELDQIPVVEEVVNSDGEWVPVEVNEHLSTYSRQNFTQQNFYTAFGSGISVPNLLDKSARILLVNKGNYRDTLEVIVPSPLFTKEMVAKTIEQHIKNMGLTHTRDAVSKFALSEQSYNDISNSQVINMLNAACHLETDVAQRPSVQVLGNLVKPGVVIATALTVDGQKYHFVPSGFIKQLNKQISLILGGHVDVDIADVVTPPQLEAKKQPAELESVPANNGHGQPLFSQLYETPATDSRSSQPLSVAAK